MAVHEDGNPQWTVPDDVTDWFAVEPDSTERLRRAVAAATLTVEADSEFGRAFLLEPLPYLVENLSRLGVTDDWTVSFERLNAHKPLSGPRKLVCFFMLLLKGRHVHVVIHRLRDSP